MAKKRKGRKGRGGYKRVASATIYGIGRMTARGRRDIAAWLRNLAVGIEKQGDQYTEGRFRAGYHSPA